ncbi:hypothetical protein RUM44_002589 [Polyplax serrata]|uniref:Uncharacterized protein n=1 Tax=Polyplax serrata TaxID=468196 RepID=A0ABR1AF88_POLSC
MSATADLRMLLASPKNSLDEKQDERQVSEDLSLPRLKTDVALNNDNTLFAVYCFIKNFIGLFISNVWGVHTRWFTETEEKRLLELGKETEMKPPTNPQC